LIAFLDVVELEQAVLVGHSMGGGIALDMAVRHPDRLAGLGLIATGARLPVAPAILNGILENKDATVRLICRAAFGPEASEEMERLGRRQMGATPAKVLHGDFVSCDAFDVMDQLGRIETPSLVMCGTQDQLTPAKYAVYLRDGIVGARLTLVEGAGHMVMVEQPATVVRALTEFLERT
jgi:pimeloyl-ACP methyl ester carboxylesterase